MFFKVITETAGAAQKKQGRFFPVHNTNKPGEIYKIFAQSCQEAVAIMYSWDLNGCGDEAGGFVRAARKSVMTTKDNVICGTFWVNRHS